MPSVKKGSTVTIHYTGTLNDGNVFDSTEDKKPFEFTIGADAILPAFEEEIITMSVGDTKTFTLDVEDAYGEKKEELIITIPKSTLPQDLEPKVGLFLEIGKTDEPTTVAEIIGISDDEVQIDVNHPLCGKDLTFKVEVVAID